jgi:hypothetical protein
MSDNSKSETTSTPLGPDRTWIGLLALAALLAASIFLIRKADGSKPDDWKESRLTYLPSGKILKPMALDLDEAVADLLWVDGMIYFADAYLEKKSYRWMGHILDVVTILNPRMIQAYEFGGVVLTKQKSEIPKTLRLLDRGIAEFPTNWRLHVYAAMAQLTLDSNFVAAAEYIKPIALQEDVPDHIRTLSATLLNKGGGRRVALAFLVDSYVHSTNAINKEIFVDKILKLYPGDPKDAVKRKETVEKVLHEIVIEPFALMLGLGVIHEYLSADMSPQTKELMDMLYR